MVDNLDHGQVAMPRGGEERARAHFVAPGRRFYGEDPFGSRVELIES